MKNSGYSRRQRTVLRWPGALSGFFVIVFAAFGQHQIGHPLPPPAPVRIRPIPRLVQPPVVPMWPVPNQGLINGAADSLIRTIPVVPNVFLLTGGGANTLVRIGPEGVLVVDSKYAEMAPRLQQEIGRLSDQPIRWLINTGPNEDHIAGNAELLKRTPAAPSQQPAAHVIAQQNLVKRLTNPAPDASSQAEQSAAFNEPYSGASKELMVNGEAVSIFPAAANTDGDSIVLLRKSAVIATGDVYNPDRYPMIDVANGGSVQGVIDALNHILELAAAARSQGKEMQVIPGHGALREAANVLQYRNMVTVIRDRVQDAISKGLTLAEVKGGGLTNGYDVVYGGVLAPWTTDTFLEAVYNSLKSSPR